MDTVNANIIGDAGANAEYAQVLARVARKNLSRYPSLVAANLLIAFS